MKYRTPKHYRAPLRSRAAILDYLRDWPARRYDHRTYPYCFNVKLYQVDLSLSHLADLWRDSDRDDRLDCPTTMEAITARYDRIGTDTIYKWGIEDACRSVQDTDAFRYLYDGTNVRAEWTFAGRSNGWLCLISFDGMDLVNFDAEDLDNWTYAQLRRLYRFLVQCSHDFRPAAVRAEVEYQAAFNFFVNACSDIPAPANCIGANI